MPLVAAGLRNDDHLAARPLAKFCSIIIALHVELTHCLHSQQLAAGSARLHVVFRGAGVLDSIQQENVLLWTIAGNRKIIRGAGIRDSRAAGFLRCEIHDSRVEREQEIVAAPVKRKILDRLFADQAADVLC